MKKAYLHLIKHALSQGNVISVWDGEEWQVKKSSSYKAVKDAVDSVEGAELVIRDSGGERLAWALVSPYGLAPDETVIDCTDNEYMAKWLESYDSEEASHD
jgi:hypothetical protein